MRASVAKKELPGGTDDPQRRACDAWRVVRGVPPAGVARARLERPRVAPASEAQPPHLHHRGEGGAGEELPVRPERLRQRRHETKTGKAGSIR